MNKPHGYKSLSFNMKPLKARDVTSFLTTAVKIIVLFSDGFKPAEQKVADGLPIETTYAELRKEERADAGLAIGV